MNSKNEDCIKKIHDLLVKVLQVPADLATRFCKKIATASPELQKVALDAVLRKIDRIISAKKSAIAEIQKIQTEMVAEIEKAEKNRADVELSKQINQN